eukprot:scaffold7816_cov117-Skeletonema_dohrnii-CCMP3373.AAC.1
MVESDQPARSAFPQKVALVFYVGISTIPTENSLEIFAGHQLFCVVGNDWFHRHVELNGRNQYGMRLPLSSPPTANSTTCS